MNCLQNATLAVFVCVNENYGIMHNTVQTCAQNFQCNRLTSGGVKRHWIMTSLTPLIASGVWTDHLLLLSQ